MTKLISLSKAVAPPPPRQPGPIPTIPLTAYDHNGWEKSISRELVGKERSTLLPEVWMDLSRGMPYGGGSSITPKTESAIKTTAAAGVDEVQMVVVMLNAMKRQVIVIGGNLGRKLGLVALEGQIS
ncbi:hypothetical protein IW262DRAFT_1469161 [Armillaria fumosa]|nr:hypothetical protein IW262DRAFT_1469161 [Armillaria fumosa]